jgi:hypothetical protein
MLLTLLGAQIAAVANGASAVPSQQDQITASEMFAYAEWRNCVLRITHRKSRTVKDRAAIADAAVEGCASREAGYNQSLLALAQYYKLGDPADFAGRNSAQVRRGLHDTALKELK